ncbi:MBL fold metallo-hydrolase [Filobacillus milosensis]|uniref:MBL fold metallo-hydrolase n=1 Tax=Filobacillus milosensis TaxID=94137 RepID=A0A4Y8IEV6_9BACI|nr:MBL fold metallo-hydrolase [Filobacillus milosensis]TFB15028.1 MBL fold metallo-hydrolase [Filobacillus milosensis]
MLNKLSNSIYYLPNQDERERPTLGVICGDNYSLVIDAGNSVKHAREFIAEVEDLNVPPIKYLVITHAHWDHFLGMNEFDATIIVNTLTNQLIKDWVNLSFDDVSLQSYVEENKMSSLCMEVIKNEIPKRESFKLKNTDISFEKSLTIDLGNKICLIDRVRSTHTDDSTIVFVPNEKVLFLGDSAYGTTKNKLFHYDQDMLLPMMEDIKKYDAKDYLLGHESICDLEEMNVYWDELILANQATQSKSIESALERFKINNKREPNENELFFIKAFVNNQILKSQ